MKKKKNILESIHHFDRFDSDLYMNVVNRKNNIEPEVQDYIYQEDKNMGCIYLIVLLFLLLIFIGIISIIYYVL